MGITVIPMQGVVWGESPTQIELDFGTTPTVYETFTVADANVSTSSDVQMWQSGVAPTGKSADENEMDRIEMTTLAQAGQFTVYARAEDGPVVGKFKFSYMVR